MNVGCLISFKKVIVTLRGLHTEKQDEISISDSIWEINSLWGQKANSETILLHHSILRLSFVT